MSFDTNNCYDKESSTYIDNQQEQQQLQEFSTKPGTQHGFQPTLSNNSNNDVSPKVKGKRRAAQELSGNNAPCYIQQLSLEIIIHIFSHLDPVSLSTASTVCHYWRHIVTDDNCWKNAFCAYFGALPFKRLRPDSWKSEYILRAHLLRKWEKGRGTVMQFNPRIGSIDAMSVDFEHSSVLVASSELGMAVKCNPATGKVDRHRLYSTDDGVPMRVSVVKMDGQRILWGFHAGFVTMTVRTKSVVGRQLKVFAEFHQGCVTALDLPTFTSDVALSASETGNIKIWDILTGTCVQNLYGNGSTPTFLQALKPFGVLSGSANGTVTYWNINVNELAKKHRELHRRQDLLERTTPSVASTADVRVQPLVIAAPPSNEATPVHTIKHDSETNVIVVTYEGRQEVWKYDLNTSNCLGVFGGGHLIGAISCMQWDLAPVTSTTSSSLQAVLRPRSKKTLSLSNGSNSNQGTPVTTKSMRILATGDTVGTICLWDGDAVEQDGRQIKPLRVMTGHAAAISVLFIDACKLVSGSDDGWIRIWDPITGTLLNVLGNKVPKNAPIDRSDVSVMRVKNIFCDDYRGVATVGHQVKTWDFSPDRQLLDKRNLKPKTRFPGADTRQLHYEIKQDLKESTEALKQEKKEREREARELHKMTLGGLSDSELLEYALMLSKEESNSQDPSLQPNSSGGSSSGNFSAGDYVEDDEALLSAVMASLDMENQAVSNSLPSRSPVDWREDEWPSVTETNNSSSRSSRAGSDGSVWGNVHSRVLEPFHSDTSSPRFRIAAEDDEYDEELQYVLKLSESEK